MQGKKGGERDALTSTHRRNTEAGKEEKGRREREEGRMKRRDEVRIDDQDDKQQEPQCTLFVKGILNPSLIPSKQSV